MAKGGNGIGKGKPNTAPTWDDTLISLNENTAFSFSVAATDPDKKDILSYLLVDPSTVLGSTTLTSTRVRRSRQRNSLFREWVDYTGHAGLDKLRGEVSMCVLEVNEYTLLELAACKPLSYVPCNYRPVVERLVQRGLLLRQDDQWFPTAVGLVVLGRTLH